MLFRSKHHIEVQIDGLRENDGEDYHPQAFMEITYPENMDMDMDMDLYDMILTVLNKITKDHEYCLGNLKYRDFIMCSDSFVLEHPEKCNNFDRSKMYDGGMWMEFTRENIELGGFDKDDTFIDKLKDNDTIIIYGQIDQSGNFIYDYPVVGCNVDREFYNMTRGKLHTDVGYDCKLKKYYFNSLPQFRHNSTLSFNCQRSFLTC